MLKQEEVIPTEVLEAVRRRLEKETDGDNNEPVDLFLWDFGGQVSSMHILSNTRTYKTLHHATITQLINLCFLFTAVDMIRP